MKKSFKCKNEVGRQHTTFTSCQNAACSNEFILWWVDYAFAFPNFNLALFNENEADVETES